MIVIYKNGYFDEREGRSGLDELQVRKVGQDQ